MKLEHCVWTVHPCNGIVVCCDCKINYWKERVCHCYVTVGLGNWRADHFDGKLAHSDFTKNHYDGMADNCDGEVDGCDGTVGRCNGTVDHCDGTVEHFKKELNRRPL